MWICTDPDRHRSKGGSDIKGEDPAVAAKREESRARRAADRDRADFMRGLLSGKVPTRDSTELVLDVALVAGVNDAPVLDREAANKVADLIFGDDEEGPSDGS